MSNIHFETVGYDKVGGEYEYLCVSIYTRMPVCSYTFSYIRLWNWIQVDVSKMEMRPSLCACN